MRKRLGRRGGATTRGGAGGEGAGAPPRLPPGRRWPKNAPERKPKPRPRRKPKRRLALHAGQGGGQGAGQARAEKKPSGPEEKAKEEARRAKERPKPRLRPGRIRAIPAPKSDARPHPLAASRYRRSPRPPRLSRRLCPTVALSARESPNSNFNSRKRRASASSSRPIWTGEGYYPAVASEMVSGGGVPEMRAGAKHPSMDTLGDVAHTAQAASVSLGATNLVRMVSSSSIMSNGTSAPGTAGVQPVMATARVNRRFRRASASGSRRHVSTAAAAVRPRTAHVPEAGPRRRLGGNSGLPPVRRHGCRLATTEPPCASGHERLRATTAPRFEFPRHASGMKSMAPPPGMGHPSTWSRASIGVPSPRHDQRFAGLRLKTPRRRVSSVRRPRRRRVRQFPRLHRSSQSAIH